MRVLKTLFFLIKETRLYVSVVNLIAKDNQNYQNFLAKDSKDQCIQMNMKQKVRIEIWQLSLGIFSNENLLLKFTDCLFCFFQIKITKSIKPKDFSYRKVLLKVTMPSSMEKLLWPTHWFWSKTIWRNKKANSSARWRLYYSVFIRL